MAPRLGARLGSQAGVAGCWPFLRASDIMWTVRTALSAPRGCREEDVESSEPCVAPRKGLTIITVVGCVRGMVEVACLCGRAEQCSWALCETAHPGGTQTLVSPHWGLGPPGKAGL